MPGNEGHGVPLEERFWRKVTQPDHEHMDEECWEWTAAKGFGGYGIFWNGERLVGAHIFAYELLIGPLAPGQMPDHTCHNHGCVSPHHLRAATKAQNGQNRKGLQSNNTSGYRGVTRRRNRFIAQVQHQGVNTYLGMYGTAEEAAGVAMAKRLELFTHNDLDRTG
jgi:hypothetical protein